MSDDDEDIDDDDDDVRLVSTGRIADPKKTLESVFSEELREKFELFSYRNAGAILSKNFPDQMAQIINALERFEITTEMIRKPGGNKGPIADYVDTLFSNAWVGALEAPIYWWHQAKTGIWERVEWSRDSTGVWNRGKAQPVDLDMLAQQTLSEKE